MPQIDLQRLLGRTEAAELAIARRAICAGFQSARPPPPMTPRERSHVSSVAFNPRPKGPATISAASRALGIDRTTLQRWIRDGAPVARPGDVGRGHGALVDLDEVRRWRHGTAPAVIDLDLLADAVARSFDQPPRNANRPAWQEIGIERRAAAFLAVSFFAILAEQFTGTVITSESDLPAQLRRIYRISLS